MISPEDALKLLLDNSSTADIRQVPLVSAAGMVLAVDVHCDADLPSYDSAAFDGFAVRGSDLRYDIASRNSAADPSSGVLKAGTAYPVIAGDPLPEGTDRIVPVQDASVKETVLYLEASPEEGANIMSRGRFLESGQIVLEHGTRLSQQHLGIAALAGRESLCVYSRPRVGLVSVGEDLVPPTWRPAPGRSRDPVTPLLRAQLCSSGFDPEMTLRASGETSGLQRALEQSLECCRVLLVSGCGASTVPIIEKMGFTILFRTVEQHPAEDLAVGVGKEGMSVFVLPREPMAALVATEEYVLPCLRRRSGNKGCRKRNYFGQTTFSYSKEPGILHFLGVLAYREGTDWKLHLPERKGSGGLAGSVSVNALALAGPDRISFREGDPMQFHFLSSTAGELSFA